MKSSTSTNDAKPKNESRVTGVLGNESESAVGCSEGWVAQVKQAVCKYGSFVGPGVMVSVAYIDPGNYATGVSGFLLAPPWEPQTLLIYRRLSGRSWRKL